MTHRRTTVLAAAVAVAAGALTFGLAAASAPAPAVAQVRQQQPQQATPGDEALAARFAELGQDLLLRTKAIAEPHWRASAAMLQAANRMDPGDARYARLLVDAELSAHDRDAAIDAVKAWLKTSPTNYTAQTELIDLYLSRMESADTKLAYLKEIVGKPPVGDLVRAHAAARAARLLADRSEPEQATAMLSQALRLNPLNLDALRMRMQLAMQGGTPLERTTAMLALLRANPAQPAVLMALGKQVADAGLPQEALEWYNLAGTVGARQGMPPSPAFIAGFIGEMFIAGQVDPAEKLADQVLAAQPGNVDVWFIKLSMDRATKAATYAQSKQRAGVALSNRLAEVRATAAGEKTATTRPVDAGGGLEVPDLSADLSRVKALVSDDARNAYDSVLADIAWYQVYYLEQPVSPGVLDFLRQTLPAGGVVLNRVEGWGALAQGKADEARVKLSAVADRDPLSKLGMLRLVGKDAKSQDGANAEARKLVNEYPSGLLGAMLWGELGSNKAVQIVKGPLAEGIEAELAKFPRDLLKILDTPQAFYALRGDPLQIAHPYGDPMIVEVTVQNMSDYDLTVGPDGMIHPGLFLETRLRGGADQQQVSGFTYDPIADTGVLRARQGFTQRVRVDQGQIASDMARNPGASIQVYTGVMTNPQQAKGGLAPGPGGYRVEFPRVMERQATPIQSDAQRQRLYNLIANGNGAEKIRTIEVLATYVQLIRANKDSPKEAVAVTDQMANAIRSGMSDPEASVRAWATYMSALVGPADQMPKALGQMLTDKSWQTRLLALTAVPALSAEQRKMLPPKPGTDDEDPVVRAYATAQLGIQAIAATQPSSSVAPAQPGAAPAPGGRQ